MSSYRRHRPLRPNIQVNIVSRDIQVLKTYGAAPYGAAIKKLEQQIKERQQSVDEKIGVKVCRLRTLERISALS